ncbi:vanadium-dependent haloperoxidase [uncultured Roseibium sp.]|uniref:vanadium-dependent haloperoxidase n=1 Tax=uncultured Roseibium sp. TaxID=1936171 RepID=UPI00263442E0|nr:vanadium-dependent haloperoxidase [uncultured Roseibium sp.]
MDRRQWSHNMRVAAAERARAHEHPSHKANGDEQKFATANYAMSFTKGLEHDCNTGLVEQPEHFEAFRTAIDKGEIAAFQDGSVPPAKQKERQWEAPTAGVVGDLEGPDAQAVTMPPAPPLGSDELAYEMAEVYELALLRDQALTDFEGKRKTGANATDVDKSLDRLNALQYTADGFSGRPRKHGGKHITPQQAFRGSSPGVENGPYLSQFMLIGNHSPGKPAEVKNGEITYGPQKISQKVPAAQTGPTGDFMTEWNDWLTVQNGADTRNNSVLFPAGKGWKFIATPRDLATYVHDDALYQAYLNACLILLGMRASFDPAFDALSGHGQQAKGANWEAGGFALYGGPHILTLVTEVATRALKAVRFQKFNNHIRLRPEALAARIEKAADIDNGYFYGEKVFRGLEHSIIDTVKAIRSGNASGSALLPMAFQEGSPMHPAYGAGHATVAGACVTVLKAYFDTSAVLVHRKQKNGDGKADNEIAFRRPLKKDAKTGKHTLSADDMPVAFVPKDASGNQLVESKNQKSFLTLEGELNKLAANISIGRNMGGVHYFSDYYDSLRMGEEIAIRMLEEQALCYSTDPFVMSVPTFDGDVVRIGAR